MKICTITCHDVYNHGASLQAYGLFKYLTDCGHVVEIINYKPEYLSNHNKLFSINNPKWERNILTKFIYLVLKLPIRIIGLKRKKAFDRFTSTYLKLTDLRYNSNDELKKDPPDADAFICGSDQIWNCLHENGKDPAFYLDFVPEYKLKASYAASFATDSIPDNYKAVVRERVKKLDGVSVREKSGVHLLRNLNINHAVNVVDPVFLLSREEWDKIGTKQFNEKYILIYDFDNSSVIMQMATRIREEKGYKIFSLNRGKLKYADMYFDNAGPETFVALIRDAHVVISNSFHAAVFSVIYEKEFIIVNRTEAINTRMRDLLDDLKLNEKLADGNYNLELLLRKTDYKESRTILEEKIKHSNKYLKDVLSNSKHNARGII